MGGDDAIERSRDTPLKLLVRLAAGETNLERPLEEPTAQLCGEVVERDAFDLAEVDLTELRQLDRDEVVRRSDRACRLDGACERAGVNGDERQAGERGRERLSLTRSFQLRVPAQNEPRHARAAATTRTAVSITSV